MYLKNFTIENYRKFGQENNIVSFANNVNKEGLIGSTLVIGQNNAGKTSVVTALKKASETNGFAPTDFNFNYLYKILKFFYNNVNDIKSFIVDSKEDLDNRKRTLISNLSPYMKFGYDFCLDLSSESEDLLTNIAPLIKNDIDKNEPIIKAYVKYELKEQLKFINELYLEFNSKSLDEKTFGEFVKFLVKGDFFETTVYSDLKCEEKVDNFSISNLVKVNNISIEKLHSPGRLSAAFNKIYNYKVSNNSVLKKRFEDKVNKINEDIDAAISINEELTKKVNDAVGKTLDSSNVSMLLKSDLTMDSLLRNVIKYVYKDGNFEIPENQFGMGYTNFMLIIAELVDYIDNSPDTLFRNTINLLIIEEPESYMHPQMQKLLIKNLNDSVKAILNEKGTRVQLNCQLVITSHSANIIHGKLHSEDTFNNINYISSSRETSSYIVPLNDLLVMPSNKDKHPNVKELTEEELTEEELTEEELTEEELTEEELTEEERAEKERAEKERAELKAQFKFLKKHVEYKCCEMFFADACIVVEGYAEETILPFYIERDERLSRKYISVLNINGAYAHIYTNLFMALKIPIAVVTDIDIKDVGESPLTVIKGKETMNSTLKFFDFSIGTDFNKNRENLFISTQNKVGEYFPTSFEESLILTNSANNVLCKTLEEIIPQIYGRYKDDIVKNAHQLQDKLKNKKGEFATNLLYNQLNAPLEEEIIKLPEYIQNAIDYISNNLNQTQKNKVEEATNE